MSDVVFVTGGAGYIGSHVCKALHDAGYLPVAFDNLETGHAEAVKWGPLEVGDLRERREVEAALDRHEPVAVMHFAAYTNVGESVAHPGRYYRNNLGGSLNLAEAMVERGVRSLVFSSTCATFGIPARTPLEEDHPQEPINPYGASKLAVERLLADFDRAHGLRSLSLRYFNAAGADPDGELGEAHEPETHLIPLVLETAAGARPEVEVFGDTYPTPDGSCLRDYVHVTDLADAHLRGLHHLRTAGASGAFNLGTGTGSSVFEVVERVREVTGRPVPAVVRDPRPGDPPALVAGSRRATRELGWLPRRSQLDTIIADAWRWRSRQG